MAEKHTKRQWPAGSSGSLAAAARLAASGRGDRLFAEQIDQGAGGIIAGCTEIPLALKPEDIEAPLYDPLKILAEAAVREALGDEYQGDPS